MLRERHRALFIFSCYTGHMNRTADASPAWRGVMRLLLVAAMLIATFAYALLNFRNYFAVREITVPELIGMPQERAAEQLRSLGLEPVIFNETIAGAAVGAVTSQTPRPGTVVREGRRISLGVNVPSASVQLPVLTGRQLDAVRSELAALNLLIGEISYDFSSQPQGTILGQNPEPGAVVAGGTAVNLTVSRGSNIPTTTMPDLIGKTVEAAQRELRELGFTNIRTIAGGVSFDRPGAVLDQLPLAGDTVPLSASVTLAYALSTDTVVPVPPLQGLTLSSAQAMLRAQGLTVGALSYIDDPDQPRGVVSYQPVGYTLAGSPVSLVINGDEPAVDIATPPPGIGDPATIRPPSSASPIRPVTEAASPSAPSAEAALPEGARRIPFNFDPAVQGLRALESQPYKLTLIVTDDRGERTLIDRQLAAGEGVRETVIVYGDALLQTYINDLLFQAWNP